MSVAIWSINIHYYDKFIYGDMHIDAIKNLNNSFVIPRNNTIERVNEQQSSMNNNHVWQAIKQNYEQK